MAEQVATRGPGRPSVADERRAAIVSAYIGLIAEYGSLTVPMNEIADRAGVARTAIAHFVGDRRSLQLATIIELGRRYEVTIRSVVGDDPTPERVLDLLFSPEWTTERSADDRAFDILQAIASQHPETRDEVRRPYERLIDVLTDAIVASRGTSRSRAADTAYAIACLAETNTVLLDLGFPSRRSRHLRDLAGRLLDAD